MARVASVRKSPSAIGSEVLGPEQGPCQVDESEDGRDARRGCPGRSCAATGRTIRGSPRTPRRRPRRRGGSAGRSLVLRFSLRSHEAVDGRNEGLERKGLGQVSGDVVLGQPLRADGGRAGEHDRGRTDRGRGPVPGSGPSRCRRAGSDRAGRAWGGRRARAPRRRPRPSRPRRPGSRVRGGGG